MDQKILGRIVVDPEIMGGKPVISGTRVPVELIIRMLGQGIAEVNVLHEYPRLEPEDIRAALLYAAQVLANSSLGANVVMPASYC